MVHFTRITVDSYFAGPRLTYISIGLNYSRQYIFYFVWIHTSWKVLTSKHLQGQLDPHVRNVTLLDQCRSVGSLPETQKKEFQKYKNAEMQKLHKSLNSVVHHHHYALPVVGRLWPSLSKMLPFYKIVLLTLHPQFIHTYTNFFSCLLLRPFCLFHDVSYFLWVLSLCCFILSYVWCGLNFGKKNNALKSQLYPVHIEDWLSRLFRVLQEFFQLVTKQNRSIKHKGKKVTRGLCRCEPAGSYFKLCFLPNSEIGVTR